MSIADIAPPQVSESLMPYIQSTFQLTYGKCKHKSLNVTQMHIPMPPGAGGEYDDIAAPEAENQVQEYNSQQQQAKEAQYQEYQNQQEYYQQEYNQQEYNQHQEYNHQAYHQVLSLLHEICAQPFQFELLCK